MKWALLLILSTDTAGLPPVSWHPTRDACEAQAAMEALHMELTGRAVAHVECRPYRIPRLRPATAEMLP